MLKRWAMFFANASHVMQIYPQRIPLGWVFPGVLRPYLYVDNIQKKVLPPVLKVVVLPKRLSYCIFLASSVKLIVNFKNRTIDMKDLNFCYVRTRLKT